MKQIIYVSSPENQKLYVWHLDHFKLKLMQIVHTPGKAQPIVIHPNKQFLYIGIRPDFGIVTYSIDNEGLLQELKITKIFKSLTYITINIQGTFLYCASYNYNAIDVISINKFGIPDKIIQTINNLLGCHSVKIHNNTKLLWIPCLKEHAIKIFNIHQSSGILTPYKYNKIPTNDASGPRHITFHNSSNYAYVINELNGNIDVIQYSLDNKKKPIIIQTINMLPYKNIQNFWSADIHITPNNQWLYCTDRFFNIISCFQILSNSNKLKFIDYQYTEKQPRGFGIDITGQFLIVAGQKSNYISLYYINSKNGKLEFLSRYTSGLGPMWIYIRPYNYQL